ncbi:MAG TPA: hypothetical protein VE871_13460 [Longimicrobium sp.]|nr:hypothetical protein [Longimicrobium sp.]
MFTESDSAASRFGRDRDVFPDGPRPGPYESSYDVRRGYQQPLSRPIRRHDRGEAVVLFMGREDEDRGEGEPR